MSGSHRFPGSREEDAWLSDEQLERCAPAETEPFAAPVPTRMIGNGEYMPFPQTDKQRHVEVRQPNSSFRCVDPQLTALDDRVEVVAKHGEHDPAVAVHAPVDVEPLRVRRPIAM